MIKEFLYDFVSLIFPDICQACGKNLYSGESIICTACIHDLPYTNYHIDHQNPLMKQVSSELPIQTIASCFHFKKGERVQSLLHRLKYKQGWDIGYKIGKLYGCQLRSVPVFASVNLIAPVPLHPKKQKKRGFNQSEAFARGLAEAMDKKCEANLLLKLIETDTQTKKNRFERFKNVKEVFSVNAGIHDLERRHVLLVDDVYTTGSTLIACGEALFRQTNIKALSLATIACAKA